MMQNKNSQIDSQAPSLSISSWHEGRILFLVLRGELDMHTVSPLQNAITEGLADATCTEIIVDMSAVPFVDSTGYGAFLSAMQALRLRGGGRVHLAACQVPVTRMLNVVRLSRVFAIYETLDAARQALAPAPKTT